MKIGKILVQNRQAKKLSQQEVANFLDISQKTYCNFESDKSEPSVEHLFALGKILEFDVFSILKEMGICEDDMKSHPPEFIDRST